MRSRLIISDCLLRIKESVNQDLNGLEEEYRNLALKEIGRAIKLASRKSVNQRGEPVVHVSARRLHFYGTIGVFHPGSYQGRFRVQLKAVCWIVSDNNVPQNEFFITIE